MEKIEIFKARRRELNLTFEELSNKSGIPLRTLENIFHGITKHPRIDTMQAIERALGLDEQQKSPPSELTEGEKKLIELFNKIPEDKRDFVLQVIQVALDKQQ